MLVYLDSSAIVKLVRLEPQTRALFTYLRDRPERITSVIAGIEVPRAVRRAVGSARAMQRTGRVLERLGLVELDVAIRATAASLQPAGLRTLDAIHIATALELGDDVSSFVTYDGRQAEASRDAGIEAVSPH